MTVSSIGSIPEPLPGISQKGEVYEYVDVKTGLLIDRGATAVFAAGNVLTGKGNIKDSLESGTEVGLRVAESYLGLSDEKVPLAQGERREAHRQGEQIAQMLTERAPLPAPKVAELMTQVRERQRAVGYEGDYRAWISRVTPPDLQ
jgi:hypothetical protein